MATETKDSILKELKENLVYDLNESDPSVGITPVTDLKEWAEENIDNIEGVTLLKAESTCIVVSCEGYLYEIFDNVQRVSEDEYESYWDIRHYNPNEDNEVNSM